MFALLSRARKLPGAFIAIVAMIALASCDMPTSGGGGPRIDTSRPVPVALLVPAGSPTPGDAALARSLENAARLAMAELDGVTIDLRVYDTMGDPTQAAEVARTAAANGAKIILGPVYGQNAAAAGVAVRNRSINLLAFSNNPDIAGGNVYILGATYRNTANRLVRYATAQGKGNIMIVHANSAAELAARDAISTAIGQTPGAMLAGDIGFELSQQGILDVLRPISDEAKASGAQTLFLTSDAAGDNSAIPFLGPLLPENGVNPAEVQFMGLTRWDVNPKIREMRALEGSIFAMPDSGLSAQFEARYAAAYGGQPHPIAGLAYDGIAAIGALVKAGQADALTGTALTQPQGFVGVSGVFRLLPDGTNQRALAIAQFQDTQVVVIDPAPRSFASAGF